MTQLTINVPDEELDMILYLLNKLHVKILDKEVTTDTQKHEILTDISDAIVEVKDHLAGKNQLKTAKDFLNEL